jgi:formylglycine-generating enzyme required for sulfatase activity
LKNQFKKIYILLFLLLSTVLLTSSNPVFDGDFSDYTQAIPGSELTIDLVAIYGDVYKAGSPSDEIGRNDDEGPEHQVEVSDFWMSTLEITWDQFTLFLYRETDQELSKENREIEIDIDGVSGATMPYVNFNKPGYPLINVTQYAAATFCKWLSAKTGHFYRLPTEAEWEYASRALSEGPYSFETVKNIDDHAWYAGNSGDELKKGGQKKPNAYGLYDMHGNAAEWVLDSYDPKYYDQLDQAKDPVLFSDKLYPRVVRGGSFQDKADKLRSASRQFSSEKWKKRDPQIPKSLWWLTDAMHVGFRIVRPKAVPPKEDWGKIWGKPIEEY